MVLQLPASPHTCIIDEREQNARAIERIATVYVPKTDSSPDPPLESTTKNPPISRVKLKSKQRFIAKTAVL